jgi:hypothetical protein
MMEEGECLIYRPFKAVYLDICGEMCCQLANSDLLDELYRQ